MSAQDLISTITGGVSQTDRLLKLDCPLGANVLLPQRVVGHSRLGRHYAFTLDAVSLNGNIELKTLIAQPVTLWIQQTDATYAPHHGYVHTARRLGSDSALTTYQFGFASWMHFLRFRKDARIWQDQSADDILTDVFNAHPQARNAFRFALNQALPQRSFCVQYEDDWNFCHRLMEAEGLFGYFEQGADGTSHTLVVTDQLDGLPPLSPQTVNFYRAGTNSETDALVQWSGTRTLQSTTLTTRTFDYKSPSTSSDPKGTSVPTLATQGDLPARTEVYEYTGAYTYGEQDRGNHLSKLRMEEWESRARRFEGAGAVRRLDAGRWFELADHPLHDTGSEQDRQFAIIESRWFIENNLPVPTTQTQAFAHSLQGELAAIKAAYRAEREESGKDSGGSEGFLLVRIEAQRKSVPFRSPFAHRKPEMHLQTGTVVGPAGEEVYTDTLNRIRVQMHWDRLNPGDEQASCWMRVSQSQAGGGYGGVHMPRIGEEVMVSFLDGDCDKPIVTGRLYNGAATPDWHSNGILSGYQSKEYQGSGFNRMAMDDATGQNRVQLLSTSANSQLHLGYLVQQTGNARGAYLGSGFDLKSDAFGAVRAGQGLYVSTHAPGGAASQPLDARDATSQLVQAESVLEALSRASETHQAESLQDGHDALKTFTDATQHSVAGAAAGTGSGGNTAGGGTGNASAFKAPVMLFATPAGLGLSTQQSVHVGADRQINLVSAQSTHLATGQSFVASVGKRISLFVQNAGMKLFAAKGKVEVQAQSDNVEVTSQKTLKLVSATERAEFAAQQAVLLNAGGAYIRMSGGNIEIHAPGTIDVKGSQHSFAGPTRQPYPLPAFKPPYQTHYVLQSEADGSPLVHHAYQLKTASGRTLPGYTNDRGETVAVYTPGAEDVHLQALKPDPAPLQPWKFAGGGEPDIRADYLDDAESA